MAREDRFDYLLIESTGISEPMPVAETFSFPEESGGSLAELARLDTMVTVVDAATFLTQCDGYEDLCERGLALSDEDDRTVVDLRGPAGAPRGGRRRAQPGGAAVALSLRPRGARGVGGHRALQSRAGRRRRVVAGRAGAHERAGRSLVGVRSARALARRSRAPDRAHRGELNRALRRPPPGTGLHRHRARPAGHHARPRRLPAHRSGAGAVRARLGPARRPPPVRLVARPRALRAGSLMAQLVLLPCPNRNQGVGRVRG